MEQLEKQVAKHNNLIERTYQLERHNEVQDEKIASAPSGGGCCCCGPAKLPDIATEEEVAEMLKEVFSPEDSDGDE